jgi:hypothetical protein
VRHSDVVNIPIFFGDPNEAVALVKVIGQAAAPCADMNWHLTRIRLAEKSGNDVGTDSAGLESWANVEVVQMKRLLGESESVKADPLPSKTMNSVCSG